MSDSIQTVYDLINGPIYNTCCCISDADTLMRVLQEKYFDHGANAVKNSSVLQCAVIEEYEQVQAIISAVRDKTWEALKEIEAAANLDPPTIKADTPPATPLGQLPLQESEQCDTTVKRDYMDEALFQVMRIEESKSILDEIIDYEPFDNEYAKRQISKLLSAAIDIQQQAIPEAQRLIMKAM